MTPSEEFDRNAFIRAFGWLVRPLAARWWRIKAYDELMSMDDRMLADIGISRADIEAVASGRYAETNALSSPRLIAGRVNRFSQPQPSVAHNDRVGSRVA